MDNYEAELQLNRYKIMLAGLGINVTKMRVHAIVRDGGLMVAKSRGVGRNTYLIPVQQLDDNEVSTYFAGKIQALEEALHNKSWTIPCDNRECWDGVRCRNYCPVNMFCPKGMLETGGR